MRPISPDIGWEERVSEDPSGVLHAGPVAVALLADQLVSVTRWRPTPAERQQIADGDDVYVIQITTAEPTPVGVSIGPPTLKVPDVDTEASEPRTDPLGEASR